MRAFSTKCSKIKIKIKLPERVERLFPFSISVVFFIISVFNFTGTATVAVVDIKVNGESSSGISSVTEHT